MNLINLSRHESNLWWCTNNETHRHIARLGYELEGGWKESRWNKLNEDFKTAKKWPWKFHGDGSVHVYTHQVGEIVSPVFGTWSTQWIKFLKWAYPDYVNDSCGLHVHISFWSLEDYCKLTSRKFYHYFLDEMKKWGARNMMGKNYWRRFSPTHQYCSSRYVERDIRTTIERREKDWSRYHAINYCWGAHKTIEFRLLPGFEKPDKAIEAIAQIMAITEKWLLSTKDYKSEVLEIKYQKPKEIEEVEVL